MTLYDGVIGQERAITALRAAATKPVHAYLLVGPPGTSKRQAARSFAASLLCPNGGDGTCDVCRRVLSSAHPDVVVKERQGARITVDDAREITRLAARSPVEAARKVVILSDFHLAADIAPALLKTIEEPPASTIFVILAELVPPELVTIASRCVTVEFGPLAPEREALDERAKVTGERGLGRKEIEDRHKREERRLRTDELRSGLATLAGVYRDRLAGGSSYAGVAALAAIRDTNEALIRNPNEVLQLQALLLRLS